MVMKYEFYFLGNFLKNFPKYIKNVKIINNEIFILTSNKYFLNLLFILKNSTLFQYKILSDLTCVDFPNKFYRFRLFYNLLSVRYAHRLCLIIDFDEMEPVSSASFLYSNANWLEREVWDLFGIYFINHPDLRRILTDYGFEGFPLRKDFPLSGFLEVRYDEEKKRIVYEPIELTQEYRNFNFVSPWESTVERAKPFNLI